MIEAEQSLIASMIVSPGCLVDVLELVCVEDFTTAPHRTLVDTVIQLSNAGQDVELFAVAEKCDMLDYITDIVTNAHRMNPVIAAGIVCKEAVRRKGLQNLHKATQDILTADTIEDQMAVLSCVTDGIEARGGDFKTYSEIMKTALGRLDARMKGEVTQGLKTGFCDIDERLGGLNPGNVMIVGGRPAMGKTTYAMNIGENVADAGGNVLVFSLEMPDAELADRMISSASSIQSSKIKTPLGTHGGKPGFEDSDYASLQAAFLKITKRSMTIIDKAGLSVDHAANIAKKFNNVRQLDLIIIDYLQLMTAKAPNRFEEISVISRSLKVMAKNLRVPIIVLSQLSREVDKRVNSRPVNSDLRESGQIEQDADIIQFLYRDEIYNENSPHAGYAEVITTKFRNGEIGTDLLKSELDKCRFTGTKFIPQEQDNSGSYTPYKK